MDRYLEGRKESNTSKSKDNMDKYKELTNNLKHITRHSDETEGIRVENLIGFTQVPLGVAGPLQIHGHYQKGSIVAPLATVEASLVAGINRGCKAFEASGGVHASAMSEGMGRAPVFFFPSVNDAVTFYKRMPSFVGQLRKDAEATSRFAVLMRVTPHVIGKTVHVQFDYETGDAAGQNMTEFATITACAKLLSSELGKELKIIKINPEGNMSADKKTAAAKAVRHPRGVQVMAWGTLTHQVCQEVFHCHPAELYQTLRVFKEGDSRNSLDGSSIHVSNVVAAMFVACGQDTASVVESSWAHLTVEHDGAMAQDLSFSMFLPSVLVGSVGGGTVYATQREGLEMIGCAGAGRKGALAETIAAFALVSDVNLAASAANNTKTSGQYKLAREARL